ENSPEFRPCGADIPVRGFVVGRSDSCSRVCPCKSGRPVEPALSERNRVDGGQSNATRHQSAWARPPSAVPPKELSSSIQLFNFVFLSGVEGPAVLDITITAPGNSHRAPSDVVAHLSVARSPQDVGSRHKC